ncbi:MAG: RHS repeat-associated core domain-containing protein [Ktedonobacterales bacterium]
MATYTYDTWGNLTGATETIPNANGWSNPYRFDGRDGARFDAVTGLDWMATRAYDPTTGRFISRDPLGRAPLYLADNPYAYAGKRATTRSPTLIPAGSTAWRASARRRPSLELTRNDGRLRPADDDRAHPLVERARWDRRRA